MMIDKTAYLLVAKLMHFILYEVLLVLFNFSRLDGSHALALDNAHVNLFTYLVFFLLLK